MFHSIDIKSTVIGGLVALLAVCCVGAMDIIESEPHGRFTMATYAEYAFVFDTATGQVWSLQIPDGVIRTPPHDVLAFYDPKLGRVDPNFPVE
jgi:hypothetical protein